MDREQHRQINLTVSAQDSGTPPLTGYAKVIVDIEDVNDNSPEWVVFNPSVSVYENATVGSMVATVRATDSDTGDFGKVMYYITSGDAGKFAINPETVSF